ncbi:MAG: hypothetical protein KBT28_01610 [Bacteroidales bacterium]|nr:hypothetical protein [Candidatus Colimorpha merdihippi]
MHDHLGWPQPGRPDGSCQEPEFFGYPVEGYVPKHGPKQIRDIKIVPIQLRAEGYTEASVSILDAPEGLTMSASIDEKDDWIVRVQISAQCADAEDELIKCHAAIRVSSAYRTDTLGVFEVNILPAPIG